MWLRCGWGVVDEVWLKSGRGLASVTILAKGVLAQALESITKQLVGSKHRKPTALKSGPLGPSDPTAYPQTSETPAKMQLVSHFWPKNPTMNVQGYFLLPVNAFCNM